MTDSVDTHACGRDISMSALALRGLRRRCPRCGEGKAFKGYLKQADTCSVCGEKIGQIKAEDGPAWLTILLVGHLLGIPMVESYLSYDMDKTTGLILWPTLAILMTIGMLPLLKGLWMALMWRFKAPGSGT